MQHRVGFGRDLHRLAEARALVLGGIRIDFDRGLDGHSDADVVLHALIDALLGAAGLGDIGEWFPNTDSRWKDADSAELLELVVTELSNREWTIENVDCVISAQAPSLGPWKPRIRERLAELLGMESERINVKAKSGERVGPVGREEAISSEAIVLLSRP